MKHAFVLGLIKSHKFINSYKKNYNDLKNKLNYQIQKKYKNSSVFYSFLFNKLKLQQYCSFVDKDKSIDLKDYFKSFFFYFLTEDNINLSKRNFLKTIEQNIKNNYLEIISDLDDKIDNFFITKRKLLKKKKKSINNNLKKKFLFHSIKKLKNIYEKEKEIYEKYLLKKKIINFSSTTIFQEKYKTSLLLDLNQYFSKKNRF